MVQSSENIIEFVGVQKSYDGANLVIKDLNLSIRRGEFLTLLGASGSGKTTTLMMLAGFETPTRGDIKMNGTHIETVPAHKRGIGMVFQNYALFPHMTVSQNLAYPLRMRGVSKAEIASKVGKAIDMVQLHGMEERRPSELSGGQQQRVALARAMVFEPELILMDEPLGALDKNLREHMQYEIKQLHRKLGVTVVYVTHDQGEALTMSDRVAVFHAGEISQIAAPDTLYERPGNAYVATFIGENNVLIGSIASVAEHSCTLALRCGAHITAPIDGLGTARPERVQLLVRPEKIRLVTNGPRENEQTLAGKVVDLIYLGDHLRVHIDCGQESRLIVKLPNVANGPALGIGDNVTLGWSLQDSHAFPA